MRYLLDTHALMWWWTAEDKLSSVVVDLLQNRDNDIAVSAVSAWEIATKHRLGKLPQLGETLAGFANAISEATNGDAFQSLPISAEHGLRAGGYDAEHRDPFDRLLAAQSEIENMPLVTRDPAFAGFPCATIW